MSWKFRARLMLLAQAARLRDPVGRLARAMNMAAVRINRPGVLEAMLRAENETLRDALAIEEARSRSLEAARDRIVQLAAARGLDLFGRPPAQDAEGRDRAPYPPPVCLTDEQDEPS